ncbi:MAG: hypothetical protein ACE1ZM_03725 [Gammaproteobacteria bacterium]
MICVISPFKLRFRLSLNIFARHNKVRLFFRILVVYNDQELVIAEAKVEAHGFSILVKTLVNNVMVEDQVVRFKPGDFLHLYILSHS